ALDDAVADLAADRGALAAREHQHLVGLTDVEEARQHERQHDREQHRDDDQRDDQRHRPPPDDGRSSAPAPFPSPTTGTGASSDVTSTPVVSASDRSTV